MQWTSVGSAFEKLGSQWNFEFSFFVDESEFREVSIFFPLDEDDY